MENWQAKERGLSLSRSLVPGLAALWSFQSGADGEWAVCAWRSRWVCFWLRFSPSSLAGLLEAPRGAP